MNVEENIVLIKFGDKECIELSPKQAYQSELLRTSLDIQILDGKYVVTGDTNEISIESETSYKHRIPECLEFLQTFPDIQQRKFKITHDAKKVMKEQRRKEYLKFFNLPENIIDTSNCKIDNIEHERSRLSEIVTCANYLGIKPLVIIVCFFISCMIRIQCVNK